MNRATLFDREFSRSTSSLSMDDPSEYTTSESQWDISSFSTQQVRTFVRQELESKLEFDRANVLDRLRIQDVDDELVRRCRDHLVADKTFSQSKNELERLRAQAEGKGEESEDGNPLDEEGNEEKKGTGKRKRKSGGKKRREDLMMKPLGKVLDGILQFSALDKNGQARRYDRKWVSGAANKLKGEGDTFSFPEIKPDFTLCDEYTVDMTSNEEEELLWRYRVAFIELKPTATQGPKPVKGDKVKAIVAQAADYARLHLSSRPFQLFSVGLLIFGKQFCVAIFDRDGVQFSPIYGLWDNLDILIRIIRRMCHEMSPADLGQDPNVQLLPYNDPISVVCRNRAIELANEDGLIDKISAYPTYSIDFCGIKYHTVGLPVWNSISLLGRGTSVWRVTKSHSASIMTDHIFILKTAWRQSNRPSESAILQRVKGNHDGLVKYSQGSDVFFPPSDAITPPKITTANLRNMNRHVEGHTTVLHRLLFETVGRPIWDFNNYIEFFLAIKAALSAHKFLALQGILHRDISAGNVMLSSDLKATDSKKGFLTDLEFARIDDATLETKNLIPAPSIPNPTRGNELTVPTTRTHTVWTPPPRGAVLTGTVQFMACELVHSTREERPVPHAEHHDVEAFIWVMYYAILRRLGFVRRGFDDGEVDPKLVKRSQISFRELYGHVEPTRILMARETAPSTNYMFGHDQALLSQPVREFFRDLFQFVNNTVRTRGDENEYGYGTHEELLAIVDRVIERLRPPEEE